MKSHPYLTLLLLVLIVFAVSFFGAQFAPGDWYAQLIKPDWTPPNPVFPIVWSFLYLMIAVAGWRIFMGSSSVMKVLWVTQLTLNALWSWLFFGLHLIDAALIDIAALFFCLLLLIRIAYKSASAVFWLLLPYLFWVGYASALNVVIYYLNTA